MKYMVQFQQWDPRIGRPIDEPCSADYEADDLAVVPNVGDYVQAIALSTGGRQMEGRVRSRLFRYFNAESCGITIVLDDADDIPWGEFVKE